MAALLTDRAIKALFWTLFIMMLMYLSSCQAVKSAMSGPSPVMVDVRVSANDGGIVAFARSNLRQTLVGAVSQVDTRLLDSDSGIPLVVHAVEPGRILFIDRDLDISVNVLWGEPLPPSVLLLFPAEEELELYPISIKPAP